MSGKAEKPKPKVFRIRKDSKTFTNYFDHVQEQLETLASMDDLLSGNNTKQQQQQQKLVNFLDIFRNAKQV